MQRILKIKLCEYSNFDESVGNRVNRFIEEAGDISDEYLPQKGVQLSHYHQKYMGK